MKRLAYLLLLFVLPTNSFGMHIAEGFLPVKWAIFWTVLFIPFLFLGIKKAQKHIQINPETKVLFAVVGAFVFVLSSLKLPSVTGSSSHLTGIALGAILFGASSMSVIGLIALLFQALLLAHGGITTLGANAFSMAVVGAFVAVGVYQICIKLKANQALSIFMAAFFSDLMIYVCTSFQLSLAFHSETSSIWANLIKFLSVFAITQLPLALLEGIFTVMVFKLILKYNKEELSYLNPPVK